MAARRSEDDVEQDADLTWRELPSTSTDRGFAFTHEEAQWLAHRFCDAESGVDRADRTHGSLFELNLDGAGGRLTAPELAERDPAGVWVQLVVAMDRLVDVR